MVRRLLRLLLLAFLWVTSAAAPASDSDYSEVRKANQSSVIFISSERMRKDGTGVPTRSTGTGFIVSDVGHAISASHVVLDESSDTVVTTWASIGSRNSRDRFPVEVVKREPELDLILLALQIPASFTTQPVQIGGSSTMSLDAALYALGFPGRSDLAPATGILSNRSGPKGRWQTTLAINRGNSGGPVFDPKTKRVVAIAWAGDDSAQQVTYAIPESYASGLLQLAGTATLAIKVRSLINADKELRDSLIVVAAAPAGTVLLRGFTNSNIFRERVSELAFTVRGVAKVENAIQLFAATDPTDAAITKAVKLRLVSEAKAPGFMIVTTAKGEVMLSGFARSLIERNDALAIAADVPGVKQVKNHIEIAAF